MTGVEFDKIFDRKMREAYTGFYSPVQVKPALYKDALVSRIGDIYKNLNEQQEYDKLQNIIATNAVYPLTNSAIDIADIDKYFHLLAFKATCNDTAFDGTGVKYTAPNIIKTPILTSLRTGDAVIILGNMYYAKQIGITTTYNLYEDEAMTLEANFGNVATGTQLLRVVSYYGRTLHVSDRKIGQWGKPTIYIPKAEIADGKIKVYPIATSIIIDYIKYPVVFINPTDNVIDLELTYPYNFLIEIADKAVEMMAKETHDYGRYNIQAQQNMRETNSQII
jgi:hypothetical protein